MTRLMLAAAISFACASAAAAQTRSVAIPASAADFDARLERAADRVCRENGLKTINLYGTLRACKTEAVADARRQREAVLARRAQIAQAAAQASGGVN